MRVFHFTFAAFAVAVTSVAGSSSLAAQQPDPIGVDTLVVTATPVPVELSALGASVTLLDGDELRERGASDLADALRGVPGLVVARNGSFGAVTSVFFRGAEADQLLVLVDGVKVNQPGGAFDFSSLGVADVERVEIVRGPGSALYGSDAVAGVIQVVTRRGVGAPSTTLTARRGSFKRLDGSISLTGGNDGVSYGVTLARTTTDGILAFNNRHERTVLSGQALVQLDGATRARVSARTTDHSVGVPTDGAGAVVDRNQQTFGNETSVALEVKRRLGSRFDLRALATLADLEGGIDDAPDDPADTLGFFGYQSLDAMRRLAIDVRTDARVGDGVTATLGAEFERQRVRSFSESLSEFGPSGSRSEFRRANRAGYAHVVASRGRWGANGGLRLDDNDQYGRFATWQIGASWRLDDATRLRGAAGTGVKEPTFYEAYATGFAIGNPDLDPERSRTVEVGLDRSFGGALRMRATLFRQTLFDLIQYTFTSPEPNGPNYFNVAEARSGGLEVGLEATTGDVAWSGGWTHLDTEVLDAGFDEGESATFVEGEALLRRPADQFRLGATWRAGGRLSLDARARITGARSDRDFSSVPAAPVTLAAHTVVDAGVEFRAADGAGAWPALTLTLRGENVFDADYQEIAGFAAPGRGVYLGGRVSFGG